MPSVYRAVPDDDEYRAAYRRLLRYAFAPERGPDWDDDPPEQPAEFEPRGRYETASEEAGSESAPTPAPAQWTPSGRPREATDVAPTALVVAGALVDFEMRVRGSFRPVGGVTAIASPPERRRHGHVGALLDDMHGELRERGVSMAALWPFSHAFYRRFGYGRTNDYLVYEFPPDSLDAPAATPGAESAFRRLSDDDDADVSALVGLHRRSAPEPLAVARSADWWRRRIFRSWTDERYVYGWGDEELRAYLAYRFEEGDDGRTLAVDFWGAADDEAYRQFLGFLRNHDSQAARVRFIASDTSLFDRLSDPAEDVTATVKPGPMVRIVDIEAALSGLHTPATDERLRVAVRNSRYDWNAGVFEVGVENGLTTCVSVVDAGDSADVELDIGALSRLVVGARAMSELVRLGQAEGDPDAVARLDALLPRERPEPYLREWF